jgi:hypothetical protein
MAQKPAPAKKVGRPSKYPSGAMDGATKVSRYRQKATYMGKGGKRYDVYLGKEAHVAIMVLRDRNKNLSISAIFEGVILGTLKVPKIS